VINCADLDLMTRFWSEALHLMPAAEDGDEFRVLRGEHVNVSRQRSRTLVSARDQMHLEGARIWAATASMLRKTQPKSEDLSPGGRGLRVRDSAPARAR